MLRDRIRAGREGELFAKLARRPLLTVFFAALAPRLALSLLVRFRFNGYIYLDDRSYLEAFQEYALSDGTYRPTFWNSVPSYARPIAYVFRYVVNDPLSALLPSVLAGTASAVLVAYAVGCFFDGRRSLVAGLLIAWWPSQVFWSSLALRDAFIWVAVSSVIAFWSYASQQNETGIKLLAALYSVAAVAYVAGNRRHSALILLIALILTLLWTNRRRLVLTFGALLLLVLPMILGFGVFGLNLWRNGTASFEEMRSREVALADTPIDCWGLPFFPEVQVAAAGWENDLLCLPSATTSFLLAPFPRQVISNPDLVPPFIEIFAWVTLYISALRTRSTISLAATTRVFCSIYLVGTLMMWSLIDRVVGTAFRHRGELLAPLVFIAVSGSARTRRRTLFGRS